MQATTWIRPESLSLLDVGCNVGAFLKTCQQAMPRLKLAGVEINETALAIAQRQLPGIDLHHTSAEDLPFAAESFDCITCLEVLEHIPAQSRVISLQEIRRVLRQDGQLILSTPHQGWFAWMDSNNIRYRLPTLYRWVVQRGLRDSVYECRGCQVEWHEHFTLEELIAIAGSGWKVITVRRGGLFLYPLMDWLSWFFYRKNLSEHPIRQLFERIANWDDSIDYGQTSYRICVVLQKVDTVESREDAENA
ncbi:MAG: class I SAM-dependent methyltransferase [Leptolyngbya sp. UWPOB_LEPTO1]|uniref:class I SAM-dependent methyltransferase n=1 Tax=Leptolyngbya sp. UWPOB_LEPTO1 TaxID=2815653 RepID=UPI001AD40335|nr:class I SAM-dependent methyltransferase [Leptolyngbya sp. UWPOB_LEPTO1]MBN8563181.1 class I SAM-dependent methyltransferase [Leptolyngbya sp. UWPOB_LEPTO1]